MDTKKVKITSPIRVDGQHAAVGDVHELPIHAAHELIGSGLAEEYLEDGEKPDRPTTVRMDPPAHRDPTADHRDRERQHHE